MYGCSEGGGLRFANPPLLFRVILTTTKANVLRSVVYNGKFLPARTAVVGSERGEIDTMRDSLWNSPGDVEYHALR